MNTPTNDYEALVLALRLAITAPSGGQSSRSRWPRGIAASSRVGVERARDRPHRND